MFEAKGQAVRQFNRINLLENCYSIIHILYIRLVLEQTANLIPRSNNDQIYCRVKHAEKQSTSKEKRNFREGLCL